jgi:hypothetical protein
LYQHNIVDTNLLVIVELLNTTGDTNLKNVTIEVQVVNAEFTKYTNHIRIAFFVKSFLSFFIYAYRRRSIPKERRVLEHKIIFSLSVFLMIFNNPLVAALFPSNNKFLIFLLQVSYILLPLGLIFFWLSVFERGDV